MAKSKDDIKYGTAQARLNENDSTRVAYKHGTPLEGGLIAESEPIDLYASARNIQKSTRNQDSGGNQSQPHRQENEGEDSSMESDDTNINPGAPVLPKKAPPSVNQKYV